jgi:catechol 2,3-dioxygenase-like lactoylglutathione lyase family enzyme
LGRILVRRMLAHSPTEASENLTYIAPVLRVSDISRSLAFYRDRLGFAVEFVYESFYAGVSRDGWHIHLKCSPPPPRDQAAFEREGQIDIYIGVQSAKTLSERFASAGVAFVVPLRHMPYGTEFYVRDPDGYVLGFVQSTPTSE